jgi:hypothetical protein
LKEYDLEPDLDGFSEDIIYILKNCFTSETIRWDITTIHEEWCEIVSRLSKQIAKKQRANHHDYFNHTS